MFRNLTKENERTWALEESRLETQKESQGSSGQMEEEATGVDRTEARGLGEAQSRQGWNGVPGLWQEKM